MIHSITDFEGTREATGVEADADSDDTDRASDGPDQISDDYRRGTEQTGAHGPKSAETVRIRRVVLGYALLFSLPVGVGVAVMLLRVTGSRPTDPVVFAPSLALAAAVFLLVVGVGAGGSPEP